MPYGLCFLKKILALGLVGIGLFLGSASTARAEIVLNPSQCGGSCQGLISNALARDSVTLQPGVYNITGSIILPAGRTLQGTRSTRYVEGASDAILRLSTSSNNVDYAIKNSGGNAKVSGLSMDGQCDRMRGILRGSYGPRGIQFSGGSGNEVSYLYMRDFCLDGIVLRNSNNFRYHNNVVWRMGHEAVYFISGGGFTAHDNDVFTWTNSAFRMDYARNGDIYNNTIHSLPVGQSKSPSWSGSSTGPGIEILDTTNVNIHHNQIYDMRGTGVYVVNRDMRRADNAIVVSCNIIRNTGKNTSTQRAKTIAGVAFSNTSGRVENNVFIDAGLSAAVYTSCYSGKRGRGDGSNKPLETQCHPGPFSVTAIGNIFKNNQAGLHSTFARVNLTSQNNCFQGGRAYGNGVASRSGDNIGTCPDTVACTATLPPLPETPGGGGYYTPTEDCTDLLRRDEDNDGKANCNDEDCKNNPLCQLFAPMIIPLDRGPLAEIDGQLFSIVGRAITFNGSGSNDDHEITAYSWNFGDGSPVVNSVNASHAFTKAGTYTVTLTVTDNTGKTGTAQITVTICTREFGDWDEDGALSPQCGGDDCDDHNVAVKPGTNCNNQCFNDVIKTGRCVAGGKGVCDYSQAGEGQNCATPQGCHLGYCDASSGTATCKILEEDFCKGVVPCGRLIDNPATTDTNEQSPCGICHLAQLANKIIQLMFELAIGVTFLFLIITGLTYVTAAGDPERKKQAQASLMAVLKGFAAVFLAWLIIDFFLSAAGFLKPLEGQWNVICGFLLQILK